MFLFLLGHLPVLTVCLAISPQWLCLETLPPALPYSARPPAAFPPAPASTARSQQETAHPTWRTELETEN